MDAVAGVDHAAGEVLREQVRSAGRSMPDHHHIDAHGFDVLGGVDERFAFAEAGAAGTEIDGVGTQAPGGETETGPGPRGRLEKQVDDDSAFERRQLFAARLADLHKAFGSVKDRLDLVAAQVFQTEKMRARPGRNLRFADGKIDAHS